MAKISIRAYIHIGSMLFGILGLILPIATFSGVVAALGLEKLNLFDALTGVGIVIYFVGIIFVAQATVTAYSGGKSTLWGIIGGLILLLIYGINNSQINDVEQLYGGLFEISAGIGHYCILIAAILSIVAGFIKTDEQDQDQKIIDSQMVYH